MSASNQCSKVELYKVLIILAILNNGLITAFVPQSTIYKAKPVVFSCTKVKSSSLLSSKKNYDNKKQISSSTSGTLKNNNNNNINLSDVLKEHNHFYSQKEINDILDRSFFLEDEEDKNNDKRIKENIKKIRENKKLMLKLCQASNINRPSKIQYLAWPRLLQGNNVIIGDQTGSGKTIAYLLPLLHRMIMKQKTTQTKTNQDTKNKKVSPKIVILTPTAELAQQVSTVCRSIAKYMSFSTMCITSIGDDQTPIGKQISEIKRTSKSVDVIVSTPGRLATLIKSKAIDTSKVNSIVLDEVDVLLIDQTFGPQLRTLGSSGRLAENTQFVFVTATLPKLVIDKVIKEFGKNVELIKGPGLHRVAPTLKEELIDVSVPRYESNRNLQACLDIKTESLLQSIRNNRCARTLIFCNTVQSCRSIENLLSRHDRNNKLYQVHAYHGAMSNTARKESLEAFVSSSSTSSSSSTHENNDTTTAQLLVCTDRAARGVDFSGKPVDHVIVFDFPKDPAEYVRRVGRTARAGRHGSCTVFAYGWQLPLARKIMGKKVQVDDLDDIDYNSNDNDDDYAGDDTNDFFELANPKRNSQKLHKSRKKNKSNNRWKQQDEVIGDCIEKGMMWR